jgi:adenosylcobinamide-GDP ribazoletransferase
VRKFIAPLGEAFSFLTIASKHSVPTPVSVRWFPVVGAVIGAVLAGIWWSADQVLTPMVTAAVVVAADVAITGMLHFDGLADSADGLLAHMDRARRLEVMRAPDIGAFGVVVVATTLTLRVAALASMEIDATEVAAVIALWATSRGAMGTMMGALPYARASGLASAFGRAASPLPAAIMVTAIAAAILGVDEPSHLVRFGAALIAAVICAVLLAFVAQRKLGGYTGDVLGALGVASETVGLVVLSARW